jgi:PilZ domain.
MLQRWLSAPKLGKPRRQRPQRIARYFDCTWVTAWGEERARVSSLSLTGCYIESRFSVPPDGEPVQDLTIALPAGSVTLQGTALNATSGVGFAVSFIDIDTKTRERLSALIHIARR